MSRRILVVALASLLACVHAQASAGLPTVPSDAFASADGPPADLDTHPDPRVRLIRRDRNYGQASARNLGVARAQGWLLAFQDSDDEWLPEKLARQVAFLAPRHDLAMVYFERVAAQGLVYVELFFDPQAHTGRGVAFETVITGLRRAQQEAADRLGIRSQLILCFLRDLSVASAFEALEQATPYREWIVGVGLDSDDRGNPPEKFREVFAAA